MMLITQGFHDKNKKLFNRFKNKINIKIVEKNEISSLFPENTAHQNVALQTTEIPSINIKDIINNKQENSTILALDQVTDVGNIGAILRSSLAFGVDAIILTNHNSPDKSNISKTASGTLEYLPLIYVSNLVNTIKYAKERGYWCYGMDEHANTKLNNTKFNKKTLMILGSEGFGLRKLTKQHCDFIIKIPTSYKINSLNVSSAAAITLYSIYSNYI